MVILRLALCQPHHDSRWLTSGGPSHYPHCTQNPWKRRRESARLWERC